MRFGITWFSVFYLCLVGFTNGLCAQSTQISWEHNYDHFGIENGMPSSETYQVYQDRSGLLWVLTDRGVVRYDGFSFRTYTVENGLSDNVNFRVIEDPNGGIWFIGYNGLLSIYKDGKMQPYKYNSTLQRIFSIGQNHFTSFYVRKDNSVVYGIALKKIVSIDNKGKVTVLVGKIPQTMHVVEYQGQFVSCLHALTVTPLSTFFYKNNKWVFAGKMIYAGTVRWKKHRGYKFLMSGRKLYLYYNGKFKLFPDKNEIISLDSDGDYLYIGFYKNGLKKYWFNPFKKELVLVEHYLKDYSVSSAIKDRNGGLWITTLEKGVFALYDEAFTQLSIAGNPVKEEIRFIGGNKNKVIATYYIGKWQQLYSPYLLKEYGKTLDWNILVPFGNGFAFQKKRLDWSDWPEVDDSYEFNVRYATKNSVVGIRPDARMIDEVRQSKRTVIDLDFVHKHKVRGSYLWFHLVPDKRIFFLLNEGIFVFNMTKTGSKRSYRNILSRRLSQLKYNDDWGLFAFSNSEGLFHIDVEKETASRFAPEINLGKQILEISFDEKGRMCVATEKGLHFLSKKAGKISEELFLNRDLLSSREITGMYSYNDQLYLATKFGIQRIDFLKVKKQKSENPIAVLSIRAFANNRLLSISGTYPAKTDLVRISLANKDLCRRNIYRYRFRKDQTWTKSDKGEITLNDPTDGKYDLEVSYLKLNNEWSAPKRLYSFKVEKIIFLRWYFILLYVLLVITLFYIILKLSIQSVNKKNYMLNRMRELEQMALSAQMNPHFIFNSLNSIHSFLLYEENENAEKYLLRFAKLIRQTLVNSRVSFITISEEYEVLKNYILLEHMRYKNAFTFEIECDARNLPMYPCIPPMLVQPYVENAIIHGLVHRPVDAKLFLKFYQENNMLKILIQDNGIGYSNSKMKRKMEHTSFGTQITEERLKSLRGKNKNAYTISISQLDEEDKEFPGTCIILTIPLSN